MQQTPAARRILIVDDHPLLRRGLNALIDNEPDLSVCAEQATTQRERLEAIASSRPDLVIVDLSIMIGDGLEMVRDIRLHHEHQPVLLLAVEETPIYVARAFEAGASGTVSEQAGDERDPAVRRSLRAGWRALRESEDGDRHDMNSRHERPPMKDFPIRKVLAQADVGDAMAEQATEATTNTPDEFRKLVRNEFIKCGDVVKAVGLKAE